MEFSGESLVMRSETVPSPSTKSVKSTLIHSSFNIALTIAKGCGPTIDGAVSAMLTFVKVPPKDGLICHIQVELAIVDSPVFKTLEVESEEAVANVDAAIK